jgi:HK97 family phage portal protein
MSFVSEIIFGAPRAAPARIEPTFRAASPENPSTNLANPADWLMDWASGGHGRKWGPSISERTAMAVSAVYRSVAITAGVVSELPLKIYRKTPAGREEVPDHPLAMFFQMQPYPERAMTSFMWRELWIVNLLLWGNHFSIIRRNGAGKIIGFEPVMPWNVTVYRNGWRNVYRCVTWGNASGPAIGSMAQTVEYIDQDDMVHIPGMNFDGVTGMSRIRAFARNAVSLAELLEDQTGFVHENAAKPSAFVEVGDATRRVKTNFDRFKAQFNEANTGRHNAGRVIFGDPGSKYTAMQMTPEDLNTIEARRYQVADISRFFGVPLHLLNETDASTSWGSGLSEQTLAFGIFTINPELGRIEAELNMKLLAGTGFYAEFDRDGLMAMDPVKAAQVAQTEIASGVLVINERRRQKNRPPVDNGDEPLINAANVPLKKLFIYDAQPRVDPLQADPLAPKPDVGTNPDGSPNTDPNADGNDGDLAAREFKRLQEWKPDPGTPAPGQEAKP